MMTRQLVRLGALLAGIAISLGIAAAVRVIQSPPEMRANEIRVAGCGIHAFVQIPDRGLKLSEFLERFKVPEEAISIHLEAKDDPYLIKGINFTPNGQQLPEDDRYNKQIVPGNTIWFSTNRTFLPVTEFFP